MRRSFSKNPLLGAILALAFGVASPPAANADVIIGSDGSLGSGLAADGSPASVGSYVAVGFTIASGSSYTFTDAIAYSISQAGPPFGGPVSPYSFGSLWMGDSGQPAKLVQNLTTASKTGATSNETVTFTPSSAITLTGGDTYWLVITATNKTIRWNAAASTPTGSGATYVQAGNGTLSGTGSAPTISSYGAGTGSPAGFKIDGTPILSSAPEPSSLALLGSVGGVVVIGGWWRQRRAGSVSDPSPPVIVFS